MSRARKGIGVDVTSKEGGSGGYHSKEGGRVDVTSKEGGRGGCHQQGRG